jgi:copper homeostasis protein
MKSELLLEACVNSAPSAAEAQYGGADRVELCENMPEGGCTPSAGTIRSAKQLLTIPVFVMIRPRGADFCYSGQEFEIMKHDIATARSLGADGVVFGILKPDGTIDSKRMEELASLARPMGITCHRAFDMTRDPFEALETLIKLGIDRVLTSGQADSALLGAPLIRKLITHTAGRIIVMPGHGIKEHNIADAIRLTGASEFHLYLPKQVPTTMHFIREEVKMGKPDLSEYEVTMIDRERIGLAKSRMIDP